MRNKTAIPITPREYFAFLRARFGDSYVNRRFGLEDGKRTLQRWTEDRRYVGEESIRRNPIEKLEDTLLDCMDRGLAHEARGLVGRLARLVGCELECLDEVVPDKGDWREEAMDDLPVFADYQETVRGFVRGNVTADELKQAEDRLIREIKETSVRVIVEKTVEGRDRRRGG